MKVLTYLHLIFNSEKALLQWIKNFAFLDISFQLKILKNMSIYKIKDRENSKIHNATKVKQFIKQNELL